MRRALAVLALSALVALVPEWVLAAPQPEGAIRISVSRQGFDPPTLTLRRGESAKLVLVSADVEHCFAVDELRVEKRVVPGRETHLTVVPDRAGVFAFYCCLESEEAARIERGRLTVTE